MSELIKLHNQQGVQLVEKNGIQVPQSYGNAEKAYHALRHYVTLSDYSHYSKICVDGDEAFDFLDIVLAGDVAEIRDEQALYTVLLDDDGLVISDLYVLNDDDTYLLLCEHLDEAALLEVLETRLGEFEVEIELRTSSHALVAVEGPYSWELMAELFGMDIIGIPYLGFIAMEDETHVFRAGKHGEYAYKVLMPVEQAPAFWQQVVEAGARYELVKAGLEVRATSSVENPFFNPEGIGRYTRNVIELQLQWMVRYDKEEFHGREALMQLKEQPLTHKVVGVMAEQEGDDFTFTVGDKVLLDGEEIGEIVTSAYSPVLKRNIAQAYLKADYAYAGLSGYEVRGADGLSHAVRTCATPFLLNRSLAINANENSFVNPNKPRDMLELQAQAS